MSRGVILLAAGGTGGHMFPASTLAGLLKAEGYDIHLATDRRGLAYVDRLEPMSVHKINAATVFGSGISSIPAKIIVLLYSFIQAATLIVRLRPAVIVGFGGYPSFAPVIMGLLMRRKVLIHEQNAVFGRANRMAALFGARIATSFTETTNVPKSARRRLRKTGNPLRRQILKAAQGGYRFIGNNRPLDLLVFGGSQGASIFDRVVPGAINLLPPELKRRLRVVQQVQKSSISRLLEAYADMGVYVELRDFFEDLPTRMRRAHLTVSRGGAATISELAALGAPAIVVPLPGSLDQDQARNAAELAAGGGCVVMPQAQLSEEALAAELQDLFANSERLTAISARAQVFAELDAGDRLARYALCLAEGRNIDIERPFVRADATEVR